MRDLLTDVKFSRSDILTLQDPAHPEKWDVSTFHYVKEGQNEGSEFNHDIFGWFILKIIRRKTISCFIGD